MNSTMNEIEYEKIDWEDVFLTMEAEIKQLRKENEELKQVKLIYLPYTKMQEGSYELIKVENESLRKENEELKQIKTIYYQFHDEKHRKNYQTLYENAKRAGFPMKKVL